MSLNEAFIIRGPVGAAKILAEDDISAVDKPVSHYTLELDALRQHVTKRNPAGIFKPADKQVTWGIEATTLFKDVYNVTLNTNQTEEEKMKNELNIEVGATLINNVPSDDFTEDQIIDMIKAENAKIKALESVTKDSVNINSKIEVCRANIELLIDILDEDTAE